jgi:hypothetical protein
MSFPVRSVHVVLTLIFLCGCNEEKGRNERRDIRRTDQAIVLRTVRGDVRRARVGVDRAAERLEPGFLVEDPAQRARQMRSALRQIQQPPRAIEELMVSPITFLAAVGMDGKVIARDADPDPMRGFDIGRAVPTVARALHEGRAGVELARLPRYATPQAAAAAQEESETEETVRPAPPGTIVFVAPVRHEGRVIGAIVSGLPLWRLTQQLSRQLQLDHADSIRAGSLAWAIVYRGRELHHHPGFPGDLRVLIPDPNERRTQLAHSPGGYTDEANQFGRWYGYGVIPLPLIGPDVGVVIFRSDPM